ncbi:hypothetical protein PIB30_092748 [Stylosanthes scabra]|uniref:Putative plant transposon protein domain-containing protein n=1 Tax=Stylosanthes scabra TaxID=79078 RepID=A0ABU6XUA2_9FABA|nr:hypothetical protein [Stylosanthes scabra]
MADRKTDRKRKGKAVSSSSQVIPRFKTLYHEAHFNSKLSARRILPELILQADQNVFNPIRFQIHQRKWEKFTKPIQAIGHLMVKEFYANAWEPDKAKRKPLTYTSMLKKDPLPDAPSYHERKANKDYRLDHILYDMCEEGAEWVRHRDGRPHYLRRSDLEPMTKDWYEFVCRSILPTTNCSELTVERAMLIHYIIIGENINVEEIIAEQIYKFVYKPDISSSLPLPTRQFKEMEIQGIPVTMADLAIHRQREEEINQERMRYNQILQEVAAQQAREANKGKTQEVVPDSEDEFISSESEEF